MVEMILVATIMACVAAWAALCISASINLISEARCKIINARAELIRRLPDNERFEAILLLEKGE